MKALIAEDDSTTRQLLQEFLAQYGETHMAVNGKEAIEAFRFAMEEGHPYDLVCLDIMMPEMDGHAVLRAIRRLEKARGIKEPDAVKIIMTTALADRRNVMEAREERCDAYIIKPIVPKKLIGRLKSLGLLQGNAS
ncbi:MAG: response regulator [Candidatus Hydrogenedentota bacterium]|nr:MAG: response regulator [Candidatus Hydrogenedentota bacterium]